MLGVYTDKDDAVNRIIASLDIVDDDDGLCRTFDPNYSFWNNQETLTYCKNGKRVRIASEQELFDYINDKNNCSFPMGCEYEDTHKIIEKNIDEDD